MIPNIVYIYYTNIAQLPIEKILASKLLSSQSINDATTLAENKQKQFIACRYLLAKLLKEHMNIPCLPLIELGENSRPQFNSPSLPDFNISHSGHFVAVAISTKGKVGLDIEQKRERHNIDNIAKQFFSVNENDWLMKQSDKQNAFWQLWTLREATLKLYAKGVWQMKQLTIDMDKSLISAPFGENFYHYHKQNEFFHLSLCCDNPINKMILDEAFNH